jgi:hypothetical protein
MGGRLLEGPTMVGRTSDWRDELGRWLRPFLDRLGHKARRQMCPLYVSGLIGPGDRKSIQPMAQRLALAYAFLQHRRLAAARRKKKIQWAAASADTARRAPRHPRTHRSTTAAAMPALPKMDLQRAAA